MEVDYIAVGHKDREVVVDDDTLVVQNDSYMDLAIMVDCAAIY